MAKTKFLIKVMILSLIILQASLAMTYAQEPDEQTQPLVIPPAGRLDLSLQQLGYDTRQLTGDTTFSYRVDLPGNFQILPTGNAFNLVMSHFPEVPEKPSILTVNTNGQIIATIPLTRTNAASNTTRLNLPENLITKGRNSIIVNLNTGASCAELGAFIQVTVDESSTLSFNYQQDPYPADLGLYPYPFTERSLLNIPVTLVLPDEPTSLELSAAATIAAGLGQKSNGNINLTTVLASEITPDIQANNHLIIVGKTDSNLLLDELELPLAITDSPIVKPGHGVLQELVSPWNEFRLVLVASGLDDEGVLQAGNALNRQAHFLGMRGPVAIAVDVLPVSKLEAPNSTDMTLASLGYEDEIIYGTLPTTTGFEFHLPLGWQLQEAPFFVLKFAHADILDPTESALDIKLNGVPVGSTALDESNADRGELTVLLPGHLLETGRNRLDVGIEMAVPNSSSNPCADVNNERIWTVLSSGSQLALSYQTLDLEPDISLFPYPFSQSSGLEQTALILPDQANSSLFNDMIQLAVRLGSPVNSPDISVRVAYASEAKAIQQDHNLILLGIPSQNSILQEANSYLPQPFTPDSNFLEPLVIDSVAFLPDADRDAGLLEIIPSPWNSEYTLLAVTGTTVEGNSMAVRTLLENTRRLNGNLAVVEPSLIFDPLSAELNQVTTYSVDTRPVSFIGSNSVNNSNFAAERDPSSLGGRWWR